MKRQVRTDQVSSAYVPNEELQKNSGLFWRCNMKLGPQDKVWASQTKTFEIDHVGEVGNQIDVALTIGDDQLVVGRDGGILILLHRTLKRLKMKIHVQHVVSHVR